MDRPPPFAPGAPPQRILVVRLGAVGDVVRTLPAVRLLRRTWPSTPIAWAVEPAAAPLLAGHPDLERSVVLDRRRMTSGGVGAALAEFRRFAGEVRRAKPELALDFQSSFKSGLVARLSGAPTRVGFDAPQDRERSHLFATHRVLLDEPRVSRVLRAAFLARAAGAAEGPLVADLALSPADRDEGRRELSRLAEGRRTVAIVPFSSLRQEWKRYPLDRWARIAAGLAGHGYRVVVVGGPAEIEPARALCEAAGAGTLAATPLPLKPLAALLGATDLVVSGDTGPMHLAWAAGARVIAIFGPTDPVLNAPWGDGHEILAPSRPTRRDDADKFPGLTPELVLERALEHLASGRPRRSVETTC